MNRETEIKCLIWELAIARKLGASAWAKGDMDAVNYYAKNELAVAEKFKALERSYGNAPPKTGK